MQKDKLKQIIKKVITELNAQEKTERYIVTIDFYIYAKDDTSAISKAQRIAEKQTQQYDNSATVLKVEKQPWGVLDSKIIYGRG